MKKNTDHCFIKKDNFFAHFTKIVTVICILLIAAGCGHQSKQEQASGSVSIDTVKNDFFPVTSFLKGQLLQFDSLQVTPLQVTTQNGKTDSAWIKISDLKPLLKDFTAFEINNTNLLPFFTESKFNDESTEAITFTYTPKGTLPDSISIRHWDVYITPETGKVKRVYVVQQLLKDGKRYQQQLTWQTDKSARIIAIQDKPDGSSEIIKDTKITWDF